MRANDGKLVRGQLILQMSYFENGLAVRSLDGIDSPCFELGAHCPEKDQLC
jgi:hypothetical protein